MGHVVELGVGPLAVDGEELKVPHADERASRHQDILNAEFNGDRVVFAVPVDGRDAVKRDPFAHVGDQVFPLRRSLEATVHLLGDDRTPLGACPTGTGFEVDVEEVTRFEEGILQLLDGLMGADRPFEGVEIGKDPVLLPLFLSPRLVPIEQTIDLGAVLSAWNVGQAHLLDGILNGTGVFESHLISGCA
jgi:hypothetical protein